MKKILFSIMCLVAMTACAQDKNFSLTLNTATKDGSTMYYIVRDYTTDKPKVDSVYVKDGRAEWTAKIDQPEDAMIVGNNKEKRPSYILTIVPDEEAVISLGADEGTFYVSGSRYYSQSDAADHYAEKIVDEANANAEGKPVDQQKKIREQLIDKIADYVKQHNTEEGVILMSNYLGYDVLEKLLSPEVRNGRLKGYLDAHIAQEKKAQEEQAAEEAKIAAMSGKPAPDFTLTDINGKSLKLSSLKGKYVILDFWGSWCIWCIRGIPKMKEYYNKYKGQFEILGVDCNDTDQKWRDAVKKYEIPWLHVYNPKTSTVCNDYNIQGYPTKILIDPQGNIVRTVVGEDPKFYDFLDQTFQIKK